MRDRTNASVVLVRAARAALLCSLALASARVARFAVDVREARRRTRGARRSERPVAHAARSVLVAGDSLAFGLGPDGPESSIAGLLAREFAEADVRSVASVGAVTADIPRQIATTDREVHDLVLVVVGGNDVIRHTPLHRLRSDLREALRATRRRGRSTVVCSSANVGGAPIFFWPLNRLLDRRSLAVRDLFRATCREEGVPFVSFCFERRRDVFGLYPELFYAADGLHPTAAAYRLCYQLVKVQAPLDRLRAPVSA